MNFKLSIVCATFVAVLMASTSSAGTMLFRDEMTDAAPWGVNVGGPGDVAYTFDYAYNILGIPEAPNTQGGDAATRGVKLEANQNSPGTVDFFTLYPTGQNFTGSYRLRFDAWQNFEVDGGGTTEFLGGGIGYDNVTADIASGAQAMSTGEGGSSNDWRAFKSPPQFFIPDADMAAGTHQGSDPYYADFLPAVPAAQGQAGTSVAGSPGFQWITWDIAVVGRYRDDQYRETGCKPFADCPVRQDGYVGWLGRCLDRREHLVVLCRLLRFRQHEPRAWPSA